MSDYRYVQKVKKEKVWMRSSVTILREMVEWMEKMWNRAAELKKAPSL